MTALPLAADGESGAHCRTARIAVFDVDGTLLRGDTMLHCARLLRTPPALIGRILRFVPSLLRRAVGLISTGQFKERFLRVFITDDPQLESIVEGPLTALLLRRLHPPAIERLRWHQSRGDRVILCTASPVVLLRPLAERLGVELIGTQLKQLNGRWLPELDGPNCKGPEKVRRLELELGPLDASLLEAYGDSRGDRELLQLSQRPHYRSFSDTTRPYPLFRLGPLLPAVALALLAYGLIGFWSKGDQLLPLLLGLWPTILSGLGLVLIGYGIRYVRWRLLLHSLGQSPPIATDARLWMGSFAFTATPGKSGEALRSLLLKQHCGTPIPLSLAALVIERFTDGTAVLLLLLVNLPLLLHWKVPLLIPLLSVSLVVLIVIGLSRQRRFQSRLLRTVQRRLPHALGSASDEGLAALTLLMRPTLLLLVTVIAALAWTLEGVSLALLLRGMGEQAVSWGGCIVAHTSAGLLGALSLLPGGLGSTEAGTVGLLTLLGTPLSAATSSTLLIRLMTLWFATALGALCLSFGAIGSTHHRG